MMYLRSTYVHWLVVESGTHLLHDVELAGVVLLAHAQGGWKEVVLGIGGESGLNSGGVPFALSLDEFLGKVLLLLTCHVCGVGMWEKLCFEKTVYCRRVWMYEGQEAKIMGG